MTTFLSRCWSVLSFYMITQDENTVLTSQYRIPTLIPCAFSSLRVDLHTHIKTCLNIHFSSFIDIHMHMIQGKKMNQILKMYT